MTLIIILLSIIAISNSYMDKLAFKPNTLLWRHDWWLGRGKYSNDKRTWLLKHPLSFMSDGWHFCKAIMRLSESLLGALFLTNDFIWIAVDTILIYLCIGIIFEVFYGELYKL